MFHLFKKIYIEDVRFHDIHENRGVVSVTDGYPVLKEDLLFGKGKLHFFTDDADVFIRDSFQATLSKLLNSNDEDKVIIYADSDIYYRLIAFFVTAVFKNLSFSAFKELINNQILKDKRYAVRNKYSFGPVSEYIVTEEFLQEVYDEQNQYNKEDLIRLIKKYWEFVSVEYQVAQYLRKGESTFLPNIFHKFLRRYYNELYTEFRFEIEEEYYSNRIFAENYPAFGMCEIGLPLIYQSTDYPLTARNDFQTGNDIFTFFKPDELEALRLEFRKLFSDLSGLTESLIKTIMLGWQTAVKPNASYSDVDKILDALKNSAHRNNFFTKEDLRNIDIGMIRFFLDLDKSNLDLFTVVVDK